MTAPKQPQDHKKQKPPVKDVDGGKQVTLSGVTVTVDSDSLNDFELLDDLRAIDVDKNASRLPGILRKLVGDDFSAVMDALRDEKTGRVTIEAGTEFVKDLFEVLNPNS
jgi:hypothetical protein